MEESVAPKGRRGSGRAIHQHSSNNPENTLSKSTTDYPQIAPTRLKKRRRLTQIKIKEWRPSAFRLTSSTVALRAMADRSPEGLRRTGRFTSSPLRSASYAGQDARQVALRASTFALRASADKSADRSADKPRTLFIDQLFGR
jgi:hypothetical protein